MKREFYQEKISLPEENFGENAQYSNHSRKGSPKGGRRQFASPPPASLRGRREKVLPDEETVQEFSRSARTHSFPTEDGYPRVVGRIPDCGGACRRWTPSEPYEKVEQKRGIRFTPLTMILFWGSGVTTGAILLFALTVAGMIPIPSSTGNRMIAHDEKIPSAEEKTSVEEPVFTISQTEDSVPEVSFLAANSVSDAHAVEPALASSSVTDFSSVSRAKEEQKDLFNDIPAWNAPELNTADIPRYDSFVDSRAQTASDAEIASTTPSSKDSWGETVKAARPQTDIPLSSYNEVGSSMTMDEVYSWSDLSAQIQQKEDASATKMETATFVPMKNGMTRLDPSTAQMAAANNYYPESTYPQIPQENPSYALAQSEMGNTPIPENVPANLPYGGTTGGRFSGYQVQPQSSNGRVSATAMRPEYGIH